MLRLDQIMTSHVVALSPEHSLRDAMSLLTSRHISGAPVLSNDRVVGVITLTDLAEFAASDPGVPAAHPELAEWGEWQDSGDSADLTEGEEPPSVFFTEMWDDAGAEVTARLEETRGAEWNALQEHTVDEAMTRRVHSLAPSTPVEFAARYMRGAGIHRVLVMSNGRLLGIVTTKDISDAVADRRFVTREYVFGRPRTRGT